MKIVENRSFGIQNQNNHHRIRPNSVKYSPIQPSIAKYEQKEPNTTKLKQKQPWFANIDRYFS